MVAGGYEAVALEQPLITSNWNPLKRYFCKGTIHVDNSPEDIIKAIRLAQDEKEELREQMRQLKIERINEYENKIIEFTKLLNQ
jgi:ribosomal protein L20